VFPARLLTVMQETLPALYNLTYMHMECYLKLFSQNDLLLSV